MSLDDDNIESPRFGQNNLDKTSVPHTQRVGRAKNIARWIVLGAVFIFLAPVIIAVLLPGFHQWREALRQNQTKQNLFAIGAATERFEASKTHLPPMDLPLGNVRQSWLTDLLPFLDQKPLYDRINKMAEWNDTTNEAPMSVVVSSYLNPSLNTKTDPNTGLALAHCAGNVHVFGSASALRWDDFTDGTSETMLAGTVANGLVPWGDPNNLRNLSDGVGAGPKQFLFTPQARHFAIILLADGTVRFISANADLAITQGLSIPNDGVLPPLGY